MYMPLVASEDGVVQLIKQPGVSLEPGDILGILTLDDPSRVKHAKPFEGLLPPLGPPAVPGHKPHQKLAQCLEVLNDILDGYDNQSIMASTFKELIAVLHDPQLPYSEVNAIISALSGRIPSKLEDNIRAAMEVAKSKGDGHDFPANRIKKIIDQYAHSSVLPQDRAIFNSKIAGLLDVLEKYSHGLKGHETETIANLLGRYEATERLFGGSIEARVLALREQHKDDLDKVVRIVLSHIKVQNKAKLIFTILDYIKTSGLNVSNVDSKLYKVLQGLASLEAKYVRSCSILPITDIRLGPLPKCRSRLARFSSLVRCRPTRSASGKWRLS